jgi:hypothetical protein
MKEISRLAFAFLAQDQPVAEHYRQSHLYNPADAAGQKTRLLSVE